MKNILLIEDREGLRRVYAEFLKRKGYAVTEARSVEDALVILENREFPLVITDYMLPGENGLDLLQRLKERDPEQAVIVMTAFGEVKLAVKAIKAGAYDFLEKPVDLDHLEIVAARALERQQMQRDQAFRQARDDSCEGEIAGNSEPLRAALSLAEKVAATNTTCLLLGESGVGKELFAKHIHRNSSRADREIVSINCASIPEDLVESELFGHERGAFTGASAKKIGLMEVAAGSTLFLDEIGELPLALQPKLLRAIQTGEIMRVGGTRVLPIDTRLICATNRDLELGVREGWFREDLYYRLAVFPIEIPPLRDRVEDIGPLAKRFLTRHGLPPLAPELEARLSEYHWPGNVRELENLIERAAILSQGKALNDQNFPEGVFTSRGRVSVTVPLDLSCGFKENLEQVRPYLESQFIQFILTEENGNRERAAHRLGISVKTLYNKIKSLDL